jgi:hypothetical protein
MTTDPKCPTTGFLIRNCACADCMVERALKVEIRPWTGRLWSARATVDGRRIEPQAVEPFDRGLGAGPVPLLLLGAEWGDNRVIGTVDGLDEINGIGVAVGTTKLPPGTYSVGMGLRNVSVETNEVDDGNDVEQTVTAATLGEVTVYTPESGQTPAWPEASIVVHGVES